MHALFLGESQEVHFIQGRSRISPTELPLFIVDGPWAAFVVCRLGYGYNVGTICARPALAVIVIGICVGASPPERRTYIIPCLATVLPRYSTVSLVDILKAGKIKGTYCSLRKQGGYYPVLDN